MEPKQTSRPDVGRAPRVVAPSAGGCATRRPVRCARAAASAHARSGSQPASQPARWSLVRLLASSASKLASSVVQAASSEQLGRSLEDAPARRVTSRLWLAAARREFEATQELEAKSRPPSKQERKPARPQSKEEEEDEEASAAVQLPQAFQRRRRRLLAAAARAPGIHSLGLKPCLYLSKQSPVGVGARASLSILQAAARTRAHTRVDLQTHSRTYTRAPSASP